MRRLQDYAWPGNVRELRNVIERAVITSAGPIIQVDPLGRQAPPEEVAAEPLDLEETERRHILSVLEMTSWRVEGGGGAAELLNMNPSTLRSRLKKLGIAKPSDRPRGMARPAVNTRDSD
jgi:DNA-binding NtrC family response regulator